jgi:hypothetical protein
MDDAWRWAQGFHMNRYRSAGLSTAAALCFLSGGGTTHPATSGETR